MTGFENRVLQTIRHFGMVDPGGSVAVALSGGPDSVALLLALLRIRGILRCELSAIHYHHNVRGRDADRDEVFVAELCERLGVPLRIGRRTAAPASQRNLEGALREARYDYFRSELAGAGISLATGHTADDQAETVLLKLIRGAGATGLAGIFPVRWWGDGRQSRLRIIRPLLQVSREQILEFLQEGGWSYRQDSTNLDPSLDRNWVRLQLIPQIRQRLNPRLAATLGRSADFHRELAEVMADEADRFLTRHSKWSAGDLALAIEPLLATSRFWRNAILREAARRLGDGNELGSEHVSQIAALLELPSGRRFEGPGTLRAWKERSELVFSCRVTPNFEMELSIPGEVFVQGTGRRIRASRDPEEADRPERILFELAEDCITVRNLRRLDCIQYSEGCRRRLRKVSELLGEKGIPRRLQEGLLVLAAGDELIWVEGLGVSSNRRPRQGASGLVAVDIEESR